MYYNKAGGQIFYAWQKKSPINSWTVVISTSFQMLVHLKAGWNIVKMAFVFLKFFHKKMKKGENMKKVHKN